VRPSAFLGLEIRIVAIVSALLFSISARAQIGPQAVTSSGISDWMDEAIGNSAVEQDGNAIYFSCFDTKAKILFNRLSRKVRVEVIQDRNGKFENRLFGNNACYHRIEDTTGKRADDFCCDLILLIADLLAD
jgi:hypothetical protein